MPAAQRDQIDGACRMRGEIDCCALAATWRPKRRGASQALLVEHSPESSAALDDLELDVHHHHLLLTVLVRLPLAPVVPPPGCRGVHHSSRGPLSAWVHSLNRWQLPNGYRPSAHRRRPVLPLQSPLRRPRLKTETTLLLYPPPTRSSSASKTSVRLFPTLSSHKLIGSEVREYLVSCSHPCFDHFLADVFAICLAQDGSSYARSPPSVPSPYAPLNAPARSGRFHTKPLQSMCFVWHRLLERNRPTTLRA